MSVEKTYNCDICETTEITKGITGIFETDMSGEHNAPRYRLKNFLNTLEDSNAPKIIHICADCQKKINNPV
jgi:hypothetical protein